MSQRATEETFQHQYNTHLIADILFKSAKKSIYANEKE